MIGCSPMCFYYCELFYLSCFCCVGTTYARLFRCVVSSSYVFCKVSIWCDSNQLSAAVQCVLIIVSYSTCSVLFLFCCVWDCLRTSFPMCRFFFLRICVTCGQHCTMNLPLHSNDVVHKVRVLQCIDQVTMVDGDHVISNRPCFV